MTKIFKPTLWLLLTIHLVIVGQAQQSMPNNATLPNLPVLQTYDLENSAPVMVLGTHHFRQEQHYDELSAENQQLLKQLIEALEKFQPTKVVIEWEPSFAATTNEKYQNYLKGEFSIDSLANEVYQLGFRMAKQMGHDSIYLFDDQTPFIGSLEGFTFDKFGAYAEEQDPIFFKAHEALLIERYGKNQTALQALNLYDYLLMINSPEANKINAQRMHMYEVRVGIQKNWQGPDWLGRFYRRNVRMMANVLQFTDVEKDRILIIVGDNHKWILDQLFEYTPDFKRVSSYDYLLQGRN